MIKNSAKTDLKKIKQSNLKKQFEAILEVLKQDPYYPNQSFEKLQLKLKQAGRYSRRINQQHRVVYTVDDETKTVETYSGWSQYK